MHVLTLEKLAKDGLLAGKRVLIRSDLNAPHDENGRITNETRLVASVPAIRTALDAGAAVMVLWLIWDDMKSEIHQCEEKWNSSII
mgnify:CR=1 FL=1